MTRLAVPDIVQAMPKARSIPQEWLDTVAGHLEAWVAKQRGGPLSEREIGKRLKVSSFTVNKLRHREGPLGLDVLVRLRNGLRVPMEELLGLAPLAVADDPEAEGATASNGQTEVRLEEVRRILREELDAYDARTARLRARRT